MSADETTPVVTVVSEALPSPWVVYIDEAPDGVLAHRYVIVSVSTGVASLALCGGVDMVSPTIAVTCVSAGHDGQMCAREAKAAARLVRDALTSARLSVGQATWLIEHLVSSRTARDETVPGVTVYTVDQYVMRYQP